MKMRKTMMSALSYVAFTVGLTGAVQAATWDMPTPYPDKTFHTQNIIEFAKDVEAATDGALKIKVHSAGSLFKHPEIKNAVRGGQVPIGEFFFPVSLTSMQFSVQILSRFWQPTMMMLKSSGIVSVVLLPSFSTNRG